MSRARLVYPPKEAVSIIAARLHGVQRLIVLATVSVLVLLLGRTTVGQDHAASTAAERLLAPEAGHSPPDKTTVVAGGDDNYPPYPYRHQGEPVGFDCDLIRAVETGLPASPYCMAVVKGNTRRVHRLNEGLGVLKATGRYREIHEKWFGGYEPKSRVNTKELVLAAAIIVSLLAASLLWSWSLHRQVRHRIAELRTSEEKYRLLVNTTIEGVAVMDGQRLVFANPAVVAITRFPVEQLLARPFSELIHPDDRDTVWNHICRTLADDKGPAQCQFRIIPRGGAPRWILCHSVGIRWEGRTCCLGLLTDITERKQAEDALRDERDFSQTLVQSSPAFFVAVRADGQTLMMNESMHRALGYTAEEVHDTDYLATFVPERDRESVRQAFGQLITQRHPTLNENRVLTKDGRELLVEWHGRPVFKDGQLDYFFGVGIDVTERRHAEEALRESEEKYHTLYETMEQGVLYMNVDGTILSANPAAERILGRTLDEMKALAIDEPRWKTVREDGGEFSAFDHPVAVVLRTGKPVVNAVMGIVHPVRAETRWLLVNLMPQFKPGEATPFQLYATFSDITDRMRVMDALRESQEMAQAMLNATTDSVFLVDRSGTVITCNATALRRLGKTRDEVVGQDLFGLFPAELASGRRIQFERVIRFQKPVRFEDVRNEIYFDNSIYPLFGPSKTVERLAIFAHDITDRKRAEEARRESEERFRTLIEQAPEAIVVFDAEMDRFVDANRNAERLFGCPRATLLELTPMHFYASIQPDGLPLAESVREHKARALAGEEVVFERIIRPVEGDEVSCEVRLACLPSVAHRLIRMSYIDITARKRAEAELQRAHERLQDIIEFLPDATFVIDKDKKVIAWNRALEGMSGVGKEEMLGKGDYAYAVPFWGQRRPIMIDLIGEPNPEVEGLYDSFERRNDAIYVETFVPLLYGGTGAYVWAIASPLLDKYGNRYGAIESVRDITDRKRAEEELDRYRQHLEELVEERTAELAAANRELAERTGQLQALAGQLTEAEQRERRRIAYVLHEDLQQLLVAAKFSIGLLRDKGYPSAAEHALESLDRAIAVSRSLTHELRPPVLYELGLGPALEWLARRARDEYNLAVEVAAEPQAEPASDNLRILLFEAVHGLLLNVVKHAHVNAAEVHLSRSGDLVQIHVTDQGVGFDPAQRRGGFGLFSIRERLELLGGHVEVDSAPGQGTRVCLTVPFQTNDAPPLVD